MRVDDDEARRFGVDPRALLDEVAVDLGGDTGTPISCAWSFAFPPRTHTASVTVVRVETAATPPAPCLVGERLVSPPPAR